MFTNNISFLQTSAGAGASLADVLWAALPLLVTIVVALVGSYTLPLIKKLLETLVGKNLAALIFDAAYRAVAATAQEHSGATNDEKKKIALAALEGVLASHGIKLDASTINTMLEAAYAAYKKQQTTGVTASTEFKQFNPYAIGELKPQNYLTDEVISKLQAVLNTQGSSSGSISRSEARAAIFEKQDQ